MKKIQGVHTALITPFTSQNTLDEEGLRLLIQRQLQAQVDGITILGTTGEAPTLAKDEQERIIRIAKKECNGSDTVLMVGTGSYSTDQTIQNTELAHKLGADAALVVVPYYNRPTQEGLYLHFQAVAKGSSLPIILYNIPGRSGQNLQLGTLRRLLAIPSIVGIKEASGNISQINDTIAIAKEIRPDFAVLSGDDGLTLPAMALGGDGVVSVISNLIPQSVKALTTAMQKGDLTQARKIHEELLPLIKMAFIETNPIPIKTILALHGLPAGPCRLPLCGLTPDNATLMQEFFEKKAKGKPKRKAR
jgi:4-hydroxy-tetrahydrodipicolinate synthase